MPSFVHNFTHLIDEPDWHSKKLESNIPTPSEPYIVHTVAETDTLIRIAHAYNAPVGLIKRMNHLTSDQIWFRKQLFIPKTEETIEPKPLTQDVVLKSAEESRKVTALKVLSDLEPDLCRRVLIKSEWHLPRAIEMANWISDMLRRYPSETSSIELLAYLEMNSGSVDTAEDHFHRDLFWDKGHHELRKAPSWRRPSFRRRSSQHQLLFSGSEQEDQGSTFDGARAVLRSGKNLFLRRRRRAKDISTMSAIELGKKLD